MNIFFPGSFVIITLDRNDFLVKLHNSIILYINDLLF